MSGITFNTDFTQIIRIVAWSINKSFKNNCVSGSKLII